MPRAVPTFRVSHGQPLFVPLFLRRVVGGARHTRLRVATPPCSPFKKKTLFDKFAFQRRLPVITLLVSLKGPAKPGGDAWFDRN